MTLLSLALLTPAHAAPVKIVGVEAKSFYNERGTSYHPDAVKDGKSTPPWFEGDAGNGVGAWIEVDLGGDHNVTKIQVLAGDWTSGGDWGRANRPAEVEVRWSDGSTDIWTMADEWKVQTFTPESPKTTAKIRLKFNSLHSGSAFPDTAISEILVFDDQPGSYVFASGATASSEYPSDNDGSYYPIQASDGVRDTMWCEGVKDGDGVGEWIEFDLGSTHLLEGPRDLHGDVCEPPHPPEGERAHHPHGRLRQRPHATVHAAPVSAAPEGVVRPGAEHEQGEAQDRRGARGLGVQRRLYLGSQLPQVAFGVERGAPWWGCVRHEMSCLGWFRRWRARAGPG